jgi:hypothetical protein
MKTNRQEQSKRNSAPPVRFSVRAETATGIQEIGLGNDMNAEIAFAAAYHAAHRVKVWVWDMHTGRTVHRIERAAAAAGGGR